MIRKSLIATAVIALTGTVVGVGPAQSQTLLCANRISELDARLDGAAGPALRPLRDAAVSLAAQKMDAACMETAQALDAALVAYAATAPDTLKAPGRNATGESALVRPDAPAQGAAVVPPRFGDIDHRALSFDDATIDTARIKGADVYNLASEYLGEVSGLRLEAARPTHLIVGDPGFWDTGAPQAAIPVQMLRWDPEGETFFVPITVQALKAAPDYRVAAFDWNSDENDRYYDALPD